MTEPTTETGLGAWAVLVADLRAKVEGLPATFIAHTCWDDHEGPDGGHADGSTCHDRPRESVHRAAVLDLIPPGAVLVTEETLAAALDSVEKGIAARHPAATVVSQRKAAAILARIREAQA